ncbi:MAG: T9SS type A sorting domain-containing protein, partial [Ignavibacteriae bacterium]|nr:T9SS type A sorting domain-containing protein [Ignavibacteriota bacterium]
LSSIDDIYGSYLTSDRKLFAVCALNSCIFMEYAFLLGINNLSSTIPDKFALKQNYPNPFNSMTNVKFQIVKGGLVDLKIFDLLGREIITLVNESLQPGTYEVRFDAKELSSGIYLYTLRTDNFSETKKMVLIR